MVALDRRGGACACLCLRLRLRLRLCVWRCVGQRKLAPIRKRRLVSVAVIMLFSIANMQKAIDVAPALLLVLCNDQFVVVVAQLLLRSARRLCLLQLLMMTERQVVSVVVRVVVVVVMVVVVCLYLQAVINRLRLLHARPKIKRCRSFGQVNRLKCAGAKRRRSRGRGVRRAKRIA